MYLQCLVQLDQFNWSVIRIQFSRCLRAGLTEHVPIVRSAQIQKNTQKQYKYIKQIAEQTKVKNNIKVQEQEP
jgi:hypothetical protein